MVEPASAALVPYLPRLVLDWMATDPDRRYRPVDGTMVFVDVSGFTALTERLARRGRVGAEELTDILDRVFARLLTVAWELGGGLVKFGGDALLLLFTDPDHAARATAAAYDMRTELDDIGRIDAFGEPIVLRMSVGIHSGRFDYFLVGDSHRELILTGPAATTTVQMEAGADAQQILVSPAVADAIGRQHVGDAAGGGFLLEQRPGTDPHLVELGDVGDVALERCVPLALRRHLLAGVTTSEHRMVTVGFVRFRGVDAMLGQQGPDATADALHDLVSATQRHVDEHGVTLLGTDVYDDGGKLILAAGAPEASDNDEERMLRALRGLFDEPLALTLTVGVNRGHVYAGDIGASMRRTYTIMGDAVNLAARLMSAAQPGDILTSGRVLDRSRTQFDVVALPAFHVKGKAQPVQAFRLGAVTGWQQVGGARARLPLVGRDAELAELLDALASARAGRGQVIQLVGATGLGKSRLVEEVRLRADALAQYTVTCEQYEASTVYWPFRLLLRRLVDVPFDADPDEAGRRLEQFVRDHRPDLLPWLPLLAVPLDGAVASTPEVEQLDESFR
ncbi:MAG TPA: adenylate/guanylate cyclase domain-containing protein, partial [Nitriliruptorales bacterium]